MADEWTPLTDSIRTLLNGHGMADTDRMALAVSGGADSMALLHAACSVSDNVSVLHVDHGLRSESEEDRRFVESASLDLGCRFHAHVVTDLVGMAAGQGQGIEAAARAVRYAWFAEMVPPGGVLLTAHHADDQRETRLLHLIRGARPDSWQGMMAWNEERSHAIGRPFLGLSRDTLIRALRSKDIPWREDASNSDRRHLRNRIRHELVPLLDDLRPGWDAGLGRAARLAEEWRSSMRNLLADLPTDELPLSVVESAPSPRHLISLWGERFGCVAGQLDVLVSLTDSGTETGRQCLTASHRILRDRDRLMALPLGDAPSGEAAFGTMEPHAQSDGRLETPVGVLAWSVEKRRGRPEVKTGDAIAQLDLGTLRSPLTLRRWRSGDRVAPLGMEGHQTVSDILTQRKVPHALRSDVLLLEDAVGLPAWLVGHRIDRRAALPGTSDAQDLHVLTLRWHPV